ncbi:MAG: hypothetical protein J6X28_04025 [Bacilli bacterium]|nr:hypothetical protein [Bacilli bacterium]
MNEAIGEKGGSRDRKRVLVITKNQAKKLQEYEEEREIRELEKKVRKQQIYTLIKTLPIVVGGGTIQTLYDVATGKKRDTIEEENSQWRIKEYDQDITHLTPEEFAEKQRRRKVITTPTGEKVVVYITIPVEVKEEDLVIEQPSVSNEMGDIPKSETTPVVFPVYKEEAVAPKATNPPKKQESVPATSPSILEDVIPTIQPKTTPKPKVDLGSEEVDIESFIDHEIATMDFPNLSPEVKEKLDQLKSRKIVEEYEKQLKDIRFELRKVIYEYNVLVEDNEEVVLSKDAEIILDRLSEIIDKIEELKRKIRIDNLDQYDDNYIYYLIQGYLEEFHDKKLVDEIKDSPLYVLLEEKLEELDQKRGKFSKVVEDKKEKFEDREEEFDRLKSRYYSLDQLNNQLLEFQYDQSRQLREIQERVRNATTVTERVHEEVVGLDRQSRRLLNLMMFQMFLPGPRFAKGLAASAATYLYFMNNVIRPNTRTTRYKVITVTNYHNEIQDSITAIDDAIRLLGKTSDQVDKMIFEIQDRYKDYLGKVPECDSLIANLKKIKSELEEKEYEMKKIKQQQELELEKNDAKVKTIGEYPVN